MMPEVDMAGGGNAVYVFALPQYLDDHPIADNYLFLRELCHGGLR